MIAFALDEPRLTWDLVNDVRQLFDFPFMVNAYRAGTVVAITAGLVGWFMVLRRQSFAGHTLAVIGFPGAAGAVVLGLERAGRVLRLLRHRCSRDRARTRTAPIGLQ